MSTNEPKPLQEWLFAYPDPTKPGSFKAPFTSCNMQHVVEHHINRGASVVEREGGTLRAMEVELGEWGYEKKGPAKKAGATTGGNA